ncbi:DUF5991 domain-containing protein [Sphingomonas sp. HF-S3]|uniref:DUF5991 domain-containing protein n=1 Tax=Sphingomonas rustica TaxID=3103142 RepID=A0ABV0BDU1_9SPHN
MKKPTGNALMIGAAILAAAAIPAVATPAAAQAGGWNGRYVWEEDVGRHGGTTPSDSITAFITYTLTIGPRAGPTRCMLNGQGFQTNRRIQCTAVPNGATLTVKFRRFGAENFPGDSWAPGQTLFTLSRGKRGIATSLQALTPSNRTTPRSGTLFRRVR